VSVETAVPKGANRRQSVYVDGFAHTNPIPTACRIENIVYSSIIHGIDQADSGSTMTLEAQAELMFTRVAQIVDAAGGSTSDVVKVTMWMRDRKNRETVNRFWLEMFPDPSDRPARQTVNAQLDGDQLIQCDFVAIIRRREGEERS
jgi:2-iminobutanoate/2-iminopropanoate deaminase